MVYKLLFAWMENGAKPDLSLPRVKGGEGWVKGHCLPFTPSNALFIGISGQKVKGEGFPHLSPSGSPVLESECKDNTRRGRFTNFPTLPIPFSLQFGKKSGGAWEKAWEK